MRISRTKHLGQIRNPLVSLHLRRPVLRTNGLISHYLRPFLRGLQYNRISESTDREGIAVAQRLRCCATNRKVAGSIPFGVIGIFH